MSFFKAQDIRYRIRICHLNRAMISAAAKHVSEPKPGKKTKTWSTQAQRDAIKLRNPLRWTVQSNREEYLAACGEVGWLSEEARRTNWEEFLANLEGNPGPARAWNLIKCLACSPIPLPSVLCCQDNGESGAQLPVLPGRKKKMALQRRTGFCKLRFCEDQILRITQYSESVTASRPPGHNAARWLSLTYRKPPTVFGE